MDQERLCEIVFEIMDYSESINNYSYYDKLDVVSLDLTEGAGRMIIDRIVPNGYGKSDYVNTTYTRMVWRAVMQ